MRHLVKMQHMIQEELKMGWELILINSEHFHMFLPTDTSGIQLILKSHSCQIRIIHSRPLKPLLSIFSALI